MSAAQYNRIRNSLNSGLQLQAIYKGHITISGGLTISPNLLNIDGVHLPREGRRRIEEKIAGNVYSIF